VSALGDRLQRLLGWAAPGSPGRWDELYGLNRRNVELVYALNRRRDYPLADDKLLCKERLEAHGVAVPETLAVCDGVYSIGPALDRVADRGDFVLKPANGSGGDGIVLVGDKVEGGWLGSGGRLLTREDLEHHLANTVFGAFTGDLSDRAFIEDRVRVDPEVLALSGSGVSDVRVLVKQGVPFLSMLRVPTLSSGGRANLHQGAIGVAVDLKTGRTLRARRGGRPVDRHPDSGRDLVGFQVPRWDDVIENAKRAAAAVPLGYLGVDLLMDAARGPLVVELNVRPGLEIQNVHGIGLGRALAEIE
jgi:alpha-L-glutamate ligase-like protein